MRLFLSLTFFIAFLSSDFHAQDADINLLRKINLNRNEKLDGFYGFLSDSETVGGLIPPTTMLVASLIKHDSLTLQKALMTFGAIGISSGITFVMKTTIKRPRPFVTYPEIEKLSSGGSPSFPSGHTSFAFCSATALSIAYPKWYVIAPSMVWASLCGYSRMHLGVHYPSDVLVGAVVGSGSAFLSNFLTNKIQGKRSTRRQAAKI